MRTLIRFSTILVAALSPSAALAEDAPHTGALMTIHSVSEGRGPFGEFKSQTLVEFRIIENAVRQDTYLGGVKGNTQMHTTTLYFPEREEVVRISHGTQTYQRIGKTELETEKRTVRDNLLKAGVLVGERPKLVPTDERDLLDGYEVQKYVAETGAGKVTLWLTENSEMEEIGRRFAEITSTPAGELGMLQFPDPATFPGAPIRTIVEIDLQGMKTTSTSTHSMDLNVRIDPALFTIPEDYKQTEYP